MEKYKEYKIVYDYAGRTIEMGQNGWIPSKEIAEKIMAAKKKIPWHQEDNLYLLERETENPPELKECRTLNGKTVINSDWLYCDALTVGDYVEEEIVDDMMDALSPVCMRSDCFQFGEPYSTKIDENGRMRDTYLTFKRVDHNTWEYCGDCFRGENTMTGKPVPNIG